MTPGHWDLPPENVTNQQLYTLLRDMEAKLSVVSGQNIELIDRLDALEIDQKDMLQAWKAAGVVLKGVKVLTVVMAAVAAGAALFKGVLTR